MANNVIGLFESKDIADQVVQELKDNGFKERNINRYEGDQSDIENELEREGVADTDADYYAEGLRQGGALVSVRVEDNHVDEAVEIMNRYAASDEGSSYDSGGDTTGLTDADTVAAADTDIVDRADVGTADTVDTGMAAGTSTAADRSEGEQHLDVVEERLNIGKREVQRGGTRVRRVVTERPVEEQVTLRDETIRVDRHPVDRTLSSADGDAFTEQTFEFTETDEEAVVAKEARVVEEVVVGKDVETRTETVRDTVRRADVEIEEIGQEYGQSLAGDTRYRDRDWNDFESEARADYERDNQSGKPWDEVRDSVRSSWERNRTES